MMPAAFEWHWQMLYESAITLLSNERPFSNVPSKSSC